jgi:hypothetical protein
MVGGRRLASALTSRVGGSCRWRRKSLWRSGGGGRYEAAGQSSASSGTFKLHFFRVGASFRL